MDPLTSIETSSSRSSRFAMLWPLPGTFLVRITMLITVESALRYGPIVNYSLDSLTIKFQGFQDSDYEKNTLQYFLNLSVA